MVYTAEPDIPELIVSLIEVELAIEYLKRHKATGVDHIPSELIQAGGDKLFKEILLICNKEELPQEWKEPIIVPIHKESDRMDCNNYKRYFILVYFVLNSFEHTFIENDSVCK